MATRPKPQYPADHYINRELSWLEFNARVLEEAKDRTHPLLERVKFLSIFSSNLDEFFEVRVAGLQQQLRAEAEPQDYGADGLSPGAQLAGIERRTHELVDEQHRLLNDELLPALSDHGIRRVRYEELTVEERERVDAEFAASVFPVLTPLAIDPGHPFPHVHNKSLNILLRVERRNGGRVERHFAVVEVPSVVDRVFIVSRTADEVRYMLLEEIVARHLHGLFGGFTVLGHTVFRVTRNTDLSIEEEKAEDLLEMIEESLRQRLLSDPVRLEICADADASYVAVLQEALELADRDVYPVDGPVDLAALMALHRLDGFANLKDEPLLPRIPPAFQHAESVFDAIREQDVLVHHPYESFGPVVEFIERAADDPQVLAIKQTLYRTSVPSAIISALGRAAQNGKQVTALVELKARFDEKNNIVWARALEQAGVHVVYGVVGLKTHCKAALVVRREADGIRRYVHLSTGNYNQVTARVYTDLGLFTADPDFGEDATALFNLLTGYSRVERWRRLQVAPMELRTQVVEMIDRERRHAAAGRVARIIVKMNALVEPSVIDALYAASQAGVQIDLIIRGICCLRPRIPGVSDNIRVVSVVDKFLEHTRIFHFENGGDSEIYLGSADWMPRNFFRRIEVNFPVVDPRLKARIVNEILNVLLLDNTKARVLQADGSYVRRPRALDEPAVRAQALQQARLGADAVPVGSPARRRSPPDRMKRRRARAAP